MEKIKMFYAADLYDDLDSLKVIKKYLEETNFDIILISGNLMNMPLSKEELEAYIEPYKKKQELEKDSIIKKVNLIAKIQQAASPSLMEIITQETFNRIQTDEITNMELYAIASSPEIPLESGIRGAAKSYSEAREKVKEFEKYVTENEENYVKRAEENMKGNYKEKQKILSGIKYLTLPGDQDGKCLDEIMGEESLHKKVKEIKGLKIAGYGGSLDTLNIVESTFIEFVEGRIEKDGVPVLVSEPLEFLMEQSPDIAVTYEIPAGILPKIGSKGLGVYVAEKKPAIILSAHIHRLHGAYPIPINDKTILVMPGKLGRIESESSSERHKNLRTFAEIEATKQKDGLSIDKVTIKRLTDKDEIKILSEYYPNNL